MSARGMTADDKTPPEPRQFARRHPHLPDNLADGDFGTKIVTRHRDIDAMAIQPSGEMAKEGSVERLPVATVNEDDDRTFAVAGKQINRMARPGPVGNRSRRVALAIGRGLAHP